MLYLRIIGDFEMRLLQLDCFRRTTEARRDLYTLKSDGGEIYPGTKRMLAEVFILERRKGSVQIGAEVFANFAIHVKGYYGSIDSVFVKAKGTGLNVRFLESINDHAIENYEISLSLRLDPSDPQLAAKISETVTRINRFAAEVQVSANLLNDPTREREKQPPQIELVEALANAPLAEARAS